MNDSPGWAAPGSSPSDGERPGAPETPATPESGSDARPPAEGRKWAERQPPPGDWQSPGAPQAPEPPAGPQQPAPGGWNRGGTGPGSPYGYPGGPGQWGKPPAAKPGVIPLRPLDMGEILDGAVATMRRHWRSVFAITLVIATVVQIADVLLKKYAFPAVPVMSEEPDLQELADSLTDTLLSSLGTAFVQFIAGILATALLTMVFSRAVIGRASSVGEAWRDARPQLPRLVGLALAIGLGAAALATVLLLPGLLTRNTGLLLIGGLAALPLLLWLAIKFTLASPALMLEKSGIVTALRRSSKLVQGSWWRIFGITALTAVITVVVSFVILTPISALALVVAGGLDGFDQQTLATSWSFLVISGIGAVIVQTVTIPMQAGVTVLLYVDQRIRREALDLELARAAGLQEYGADPAAPPTAG
ncbi:MULTISPECIES: glycerophosphoryl diester phosphodiesterase membrane domain-containing protein [Streptomyces]|uniref:glycerophosphoryl diester phosphodiesterase membrane domain-containing protein n=1 Tax=Streptomyces TaxID=1883 RepID=UPI001679487A|nr:MULTISPECIES: glycerophosphoryl diester phosphodiesterase membrane domain-containing protein [Streptomyces]MBD3580251.1 glycerophosphoryl diester phosphodiesterase membrane domain-containing protein [Streptomyces sp. KD18]GGT27649.1 membrane protein [Streptomyces toxytricini]